MDDQLKLLARSADDIGVFSSVLQDAAIKVRDIAWLPREHRFAAVLNRFRWEARTPRKIRLRRKAERVRCGVYFDGVLNAQLKNVPTGDPEHVMALLAVRCDSGKDGSAILTLVFSGHAAIRLEVECIDGVLQDLSQPWKARSVPKHRAAGL